MGWLLVIVVTWGGGLTHLEIPFDSKDLCETAQGQISQEILNSDGPPAYLGAANKDAARAISSCVRVK